MTKKLTPKGRSPLDKKKQRSTFNGALTNSIERKILTGEWTLPGKSRQETIKAYRAHQKNFRIDQQSIERWYHQKVQDTNPTAETT